MNSAFKNFTDSIDNNTLLSSATEPKNDGYLLSKLKIIQQKMSYFRARNIYKKLLHLPSSSNGDENNYVVIEKVKSKDIIKSKRSTSNIIKVFRKFIF